MSALETSADTGVASAETLAERVRLSIDHGHRTGLRLVDIQVQGATVVLTGEVATFHHKQLATAFARQVVGVVQVMNQLEIPEGCSDNRVPRPDAARGRIRVDDQRDRGASRESSDKS